MIRGQEPHTERRRNRRRPSDRDTRSNHVLVYNQHIAARVHYRKWILGKRRSEERDVLDRQWSPTSEENSELMDDADLNVEPIQKETASQAGTVMGSSSDAKPSKLVPATHLNRLTPSIESSSNSGTSSRMVGRCQLRIGREKTNHQHSTSVASASVSAASQARPPSVSTGRALSVTASETRTRISSSEIPSGFNPRTNE